jgi:diguanylate cyclase (GGDEF)-like protein
VDPDLVDIGLLALAAYPFSSETPVKAAVPVSKADIPSPNDPLWNRATPAARLMGGAHPPGGGKGRVIGCRGHGVMLRLRRLSGGLPLTVTFGVVSMMLTVLLGVVLSVQIQRVVTQHGIRELTKTTQTAVGLTANTIISGLGYSTQGRAPTAQQQRAQVNLISSASRVLVANSDIVAVEGALPDGTVAGSWGTSPVGTKVPVDASFRAALTGETQVRTLGSASPKTPVEERLVRRYGDLLLYQAGFRLTPGGPIVGLVRAYLPLGPSRRAAVADTRSIIGILALGLVVFWVMLFRLVVGASRKLTRQSRLNAHLATHDGLTGLPNRFHFAELLADQLGAAQTHGGSVGVMLLDLDRFKEINDTLGHHYGDLLLQQIGPRIRSVLRDDEVLARLGGDEFALLIPSDLRGGAVLDGYRNLARRLLAALHEPFVIDEIALAVEASAGLAVSPGHGTTGQVLLQRADIAMYVAKANHEDLTVYDRALDDHNPRRLRLLSQLRNAVDHGELVLHYQPLVDIASNQVRGAEALVRWQHPDEGLLPPSEFLPLAEGSGFIHELTRHVLQTACTQAKAWQQAGRPIVVSVNISARCLLDSALPDDIGAALHDVGLPARLLKLEITESAIMTDPVRAKLIINRLHEMGLALSIDDFGTGYTSLSYLRDLPIRELKIDRSFVMRMLHEHNDAVIVQTGTELAHRLGLTSVAEGIEDAGTLTALTALGCTTAQGYHLARPMPVDRFNTWLDQWNHDHLALPAQRDQSSTQHA